MKAPAGRHRDDGSRVALIHRDTRLGFRDLQARAHARASELRSAGAAPGQVVLVADAPVVDLLVMQQALAELDCALLPTTSDCRQGDQEQLADIAGAEWRWMPGPHGTGSLASTGRRQGKPDPSATRPALVIGTSGSSGAPKAVMLTRANVRASCSPINQRVGLKPGDTWLACLPRTHVGGLLIGYRCASAGATVLLHERFEARAVARDLVAQGVTHISLVPPMLAELLAALETPPATLRVVMVGGQGLSAALAGKALHGGWPLHVTYGMTETCSGVAVSGRLFNVPEQGVIGPALPGVEIDCGPCTGRPAPLRIRGPVVMAGYANPERRAGDGLEDGWFPASDLGCVTDAGDLRVLGRADELLVIGGELVHPSRVEEMLMSAPGIVAVTVVGVDDQVWGHRLVAAYVGDITPDGLDRWSREHLSSRDRPREYRCFGELPRLASGKQDRRGVRELVSAGPQAGEG